MDNLGNMNAAMRYLEENLAGTIDFERMARIAGCSEYHFRRMFSFLSETSLGEYIRKRRLTMAASMLRTSEVKIIDIAVELGYESPDAFSRAFQNMHGVTPTQARRGDMPLKAFSAMTFQLKIQGGTEMDYRIVEKEDFNIIGIKKRIPLVYEGVNRGMDSMWASLTMEDIMELKRLSDVEPKGIVLASANFSDDRAEGSELDQYIGVAATNTSADKWTVLPVKASTWAVFTAIGDFPSALQEVWGKIYAEWFPGSGYEVSEGPEILWNESPDTSRKDYRSEIWIPVKKVR
ncbi:AraC family transcriptional regulator [Youngiibacter multivorans]|uniref:AraC family transcriptional regulator n=1 Tax=Youngiibacter multivorans TaxID=937251 RepID=A0ABS4G0J8_9CLOT|nr:AraC family transcriptional regulator [Youngiibacter multivorans]MBP1918006.1 AraC family transcriptional regulator [Youngiibacter multivorans]